MNVTRDVIIDLLPLYLAGEASPATRALVEEYLEQDPELARRVRQQSAESFATTTLSDLAPELELKSLRRTRQLLGWQRWLFGFAIGFTAVSLTSQLSFESGRLTDFHFLMRDYPLQFGVCATLAIVCWLAYFHIRRRLRTSAL
jgi:predicted anti-sigma-YlaC factor YlaD